MTLTLTITKHPTMPPGEPMSRTFDRCDAVIGRGRDSDWALPDPERHLSKQHCRIEFRGDRYYVVDTSKNGVFINESIEPLRHGNMAELRDGDRLALGDYELLVRLAAARRERPAARDRIPDDFDPFGDQQLGPPELPVDERVERSGPREEMLFQHADPAIDPVEELAGPENRPLDAGKDYIPEDFDLVTGQPRGPVHEGPPQKDDAPVEQSYFRPPTAAKEAIPEDWDIELPPAEPEPAPTPMPAKPARATRAAPVTPTANAAPRAAVRATPTAATAPPLLEAFLEGAGLDAGALSDAEAENVMHAVGQMFREMVAGLHETLRSRTAFKSEFRIERTMIRQAENNPLKFSISAEEALLALLRRPGPGYLPPVDAVRQAVDDVKAHQLAVVAGLQVALMALLREFDPEKLKQRLEQQRSVISSLLPGAKNAKAWEIYEAFYKEVAAEAEQGFDGLFGRAFRRAYEEQLKKL
jgi:type VI secretion system protein